MEEINQHEQDEWKMILKNYAKLEAAVKDYIDALDSADEGNEEEKGEDTKKNIFGILSTNLNTF